jgi:hypothetical protein
MANRAGARDLISIARSRDRNADVFLLSSSVSAGCVAPPTTWIGFGSKDREDVLVYFTNNFGLRKLAFVEG